MHRVALELVGIAKTSRKLSSIVVKLFHMRHVQIVSLPIQSKFLLCTMHASSPSVHVEVLPCSEGTSIADVRQAASGVCRAWL